MADNAASWDQFMEFIRNARATMEDRYAPVALVCLQAETDTDGATELKPWNDAVLLWPAQFPVEERGPLLARISKPYRDGTVLRERQ